ncbi:hypothetical protein PRIPAC_71606 [Pristionchus pacificus]|uniref:Uncharacterized protein n=1 Tax=Pristionchus pacificus TaxID=54126 RepID=A0A2A6BGL3_PRIPA|nr:hypothetical protein PRIPAC_71606 [Pristionchus pacificus]|eukprot:PDM64996.1 hypothetical protein PRIPAC_53252 [Pristionchus pacificus]
MKSLLLLVSLPIVILSINPNDINVRIERHFPCSASTGPKKENLLLKFPSYKQLGVDFHEEINAAGNKCFRMSGGRVTIFPPGLSGTKKYYVHLETRIGIHGKPERCVNADSEGCGGIGSCVHCDICKTYGGLKNYVQIFQGTRPAQCSAQGLPSGEYEDLSLRVCLPTKNELLPFLDQNASRAEQLWELFVSSRARSGEIPLVIAARIFDKPINNLPASEINDLLHGSKSGMIGCHWIYATVSQTNV